MSPPSEHERHAQFLRHYAESEVALHTFVRSLVPTRQMASEVMQDVILVLWEKFDEAADFQGWAFGGARNVALRQLTRRAGRMRGLAHEAVTLILLKHTRPVG